MFVELSVALKLETVDQVPIYCMFGPGRTVTEKNVRSALAGIRKERKLSYVRISQGDAGLRLP